MATLVWQAVFLAAAEFRDILGMAIATNVTAAKIITIASSSTRVRAFLFFVIMQTHNGQAKKELPIQVDWTGKLPIFLVLTHVKIDPEKTTVMGGRSILDTLSTIYTEKVRLDPIEIPHL